MIDRFSTQWPPGHHHDDFAHSTGTLSEFEHAYKNNNTKYYTNILEQKSQIKLTFLEIIVLYTYP